MHPLTQQQYDRIIRLIKVLRSDLYQQGKANLRNMNNNTFCCLGVACDLSSLGEWIPNKHYGCYDYLESQAVLPGEVQKYYGFPCSVGCLVDGLGLHRLNDRGCDFKYIADVIEKWVNTDCKIINYQNNHNNKVILSVQGGCVDVVTKPDNLEIEIRDYDCPNDFDKLIIDEYGDEYQRILL